LSVGIVTEYYYPWLGGISEHVHHTALGLKARGHRVKVITAGYATDRVPPQEIPGGVEVVRIGRSVPLYSNGSRARATVGMHLWREIKAVLDRERFDLIHLHSPLAPTLPPLALLAARCPRVGTFHSYFERSRMYGLLHHILQTQFLDRLQGVTVVSESCAVALRRYFSFEPRVIPNGVDTVVFSPSAPRIERFDRTKFTLLFLGRFDPRNGLPFMLDAFARVRARIPEVRLVIVGEGPLDCRYRALVPRLLRDDVHFEGPAIRQRPRYYATADVFCSPVTRASFGLTLLEAMACGRPIVATANVGYRELLSPDEGVLVEPGDPAAFADAIVRLLRDESLRRRMGARGVEKAARYSWERVVSLLVDYYEEVLRACG